MPTIAHISDLHLLEDTWRQRDVAGRARLAYLSFGRELDELERRKRTARTLALAKTHRFDHLVITGDMTEDGHDDQFEVLAEVLWSSGIPAECVTLVPGNHDAYIDAGAWRRALAGPLRPYANTSSDCSLLRFSGFDLIPLSTAVHQSPLRSAGWVGRDALARLQAILDDDARRPSPRIIVQHHAPKRYGIPGLQWIDGLQDHSALQDVLRHRDDVVVLHGHTHRRSDRVCDDVSREASVFSCTAVVDDHAPLRLYAVSWNGLVPLDTRPTSPRRFTAPAGATALAP